MKEILITSSVLILALLVLRWIFGKKVRRTFIYGAWALVALRLLVPVQIGELSFSVLTAAQPVIEAVDERVEDAVLGTTPEAAYRDQVEHYIEKDQTVFVPEVQEQIKQELAQGNQSPGQIYDKIQQQYPEQEILTEKGQELVNGAAGFAVSDTLHAFEVTMSRIWFVGIAVMAIWFAVVNLRHSRMLLRNREKLECNNPIPVYVSEKVASPCLVGFLHPVIYLTPESAEPERLRHVLTHELTHYAHWDYLWSVVRCICLCVYWFHPLVWVAAWFSRRDCELACDEGALKRLGEDERIAYGKTLLDVVSHAAAHAHLLQTATAMNETKKQLKERVNFIVKKPKLSIIAAICMVLVCAIVAGCAAAGPVTNGQMDTGPAGTTQTTAPGGTTQYDDGNRTVLLTTQGNMPLANKTITIYKDAELSQKVKALSTDGKGMIYFKVEPGSTYYAVSQGLFGFREPEAVAVTEPMTHIQLVSQLVDSEDRSSLALGDIMYDLDYMDWNGNPYRLANAMEAGRHSVILQMADVSGVADQVLAWMQTVYEAYGDQLDVVLLCRPDGVGELRDKVETLGLTYPVVTVLINKDWMYFSHVTVVDRYGMLVFENYMGQTDRTTIDGIVTYLTAENYQQRLFANYMELLDYLDSLQAGQEVTYQVKVLDGNGAPLRDVSLTVSYEHKGFGVKTDEQGIASWSMYPRDDIEVAFDRNRYDYRLYIFENEGVIAAGTTEKTLVMRDVETVSYTVRVVDPAGNPLPVPCIRTIPYDKVLWPDENGLIQWEGVELEEPFTVDTTMPNGYLFGGVTREGNDFTILLYPQVTYYITVVDESGNPINGVWVTFYEDGNAEQVANGVTVVDGVAKVYAKAGGFSVEIDATEFVDGIWYRLKYGTFELEEGVTEITFVVGEPEIEKLH